VHEVLHLHVERHPSDRGPEADVDSIATTPRRHAAPPRIPDRSLSPQLGRNTNLKHSRAGPAFSARTLVLTAQFLVRSGVAEGSVGEGDGRRLPLRGGEVLVGSRCAHVGEVWYRSGACPPRT